MSACVGLLLTTTNRPNLTPVHSVDYHAHLPLVAMKITVEGERERRSAALLKARGAPDIAPPPSVCPSAKEAEEVGDLP